MKFTKGENRRSRAVKEGMNDLRNKLRAAVLIICVIGTAAVLHHSNREQKRQSYEAALQALTKGNYAAAAAESFSAAHGYRDSAALSIYCKYAKQYENNTEYMGGSEELSTITLKYDTEWQDDIASLAARIDGYLEAEFAALEAEIERQEAEDAKKREESLKARYSGKEPTDGMPVDALKYTTLGAPDEIEKCQFYDNMDVNRRYKTLRWHDEDGQTVAYCLAHMPKGENEEIIYAFSYSESVVVDTNTAPKRSSSSYSAGSV